MNNSDSPNALNYLEPHKRLAQRIAIAQLRGEPIAQLSGNDLSDDDKQLIQQFLIDERFLAEEEANNFEFVAILEPDEDKPSVLVDLRDLTFNIFGVSNQQLAERFAEIAHLNPSDDVSDLLNVDNLKVLDFIDSPSDRPPWSLGPTKSIESIEFRIPGPPMTRQELEERLLAPLATKIKETGSLFKILQPCKELSKLTAKTWLPGVNGDSTAKEILTNKDSAEVLALLVERDLISELDAIYANIIVDTNPPPNPKEPCGSLYVGELAIEKDSNGEFNIYKIRNPYPEEPTELVDNPQLLEEWVNSPGNEAPFTPTDISRFIPLTC
ncbi:MAG: hypothetical protein RLZZ135_1012 [Cyanobacteriota bacterium]|jgi:hypothetical protein